MPDKDVFPIPVEIGTAGTGPDGRPWYAGPGEPLLGVRDVVLVASGKGGVGKSTVTVNLAVALRNSGLKVGVLDADLYGPSVARMLGTDVALEHDAEGRTVPAQAHGVYSVSVANVVPPEAALVWKGPLVAQTLMKMFREVAWPDIDFLLVDLPPGTGDVQLTILEQIPVTGGVVVTTPQALALADADRGISLFHELDIPVLGLIENMSHYVCPCCGETQPLFPEGGARDLAARRHVPWLGSVPLEPGGQTLADTGVPVVEGAADSPAAEALANAAGKVAEAVEREGRWREATMDEPSREAHQAFWERLLDE